MTLIPAKLKQAGYSTHMVGKWHEGFFQDKYLPINRGFDTSSGFLGGGENHMNEEEGCGMVNFWKNNALILVMEHTMLTSTATTLQHFSLTTILVTLFFSTFLYTMSTLTTSSRGMDEHLS